MKLSRLPVALRSAVLGAAAVPILASFLIVGGCSGGRSGFRMILHGLGVSVTASYCHT